METKSFESETARLAKNKAIGGTRRATSARRKAMDCRTYHLKIVQNKLTKGSKESLRLAFLEAKWLRNAALASGWEDFNTKTKTVEVKTPSGIEQRELKNLGSQVKQSVISQIRQDIINLSKAKKAGRNVGKLRFSKQVNSLDLKQSGSTYRIKGQKVKIQGIVGRLRLRGVRQIEGKELANAKLLQKPDGYYLAVTTFAPKEEEQQSFKNDKIGLDFGVKTHVTLSDGREFNFSVQENERLKRLQRKLSRQVKGSKNREKTRLLIGKEHQKMVNKRDDLANKFCSDLLKGSEKVFFQDDNLSSWKSSKSLARGGKSLQGSILGRIKTRLSNHHRVVKVERFSATTATCVCGVKTPHKLGKNWFVCPDCGYTAPRDVHAAQNMIRFGTPVECGEAPVERISDSLEQSSAKQETFDALKLDGEAVESSAQR